MLHVHTQIMYTVHMVPLNYNFILTHVYTRGATRNLQHIPSRVCVDHVSSLRAMYMSRVNYRGNTCGTQFIHKCVI